MKKELYLKAVKLQAEIEKAKGDLKDLIEIVSNKTISSFKLHNNVDVIEEGTKNFITIDNLNDEYEFKLLFETLKRHRELVLEALEEKFDSLGEV